MWRLDLAGSENGSGADSSTTMSRMRPANSDTPRSCSVWPKIVPALPRSRTRASMNRVRSSLA